MEFHLNNLFDFKHKQSNIFSYLIAKTMFQPSTYVSEPEVLQANNHHRRKLKEVYRDPRKSKVND